MFINNIFHTRLPNNFFIKTTPSLLNKRIMHIAAAAFFVLLSLPYSKANSLASSNKDQLTTYPLAGHCRQAIFDDTLHPFLAGNPYDQNEIIPECPGGYSSLDKKLSMLMFNGLRLVGEGKAACSIQETIPNYEACASSADFLFKEIKQNPSLLKEEVLDEKGFFVQSPTDSFKVSLGINPQKLNNHQEALQLINKKFLNNPLFYELDNSEIISCFKELNAKLNDKIPGINAGKYRNLPAYINVYGIPNSEYSTFDDKLKDLKVSKLDRRAFARSFPITGTDLSNISDPKLLNIYEKLFFIAPLPNEIDKLMDQFVTDWKALEKTETSPIDLAAWVHCEFARIHPFEDANGRMARLLMNAVLANKGFPPLIFPDDNEYSNAIQANQKNPGSFAAFLKDKIIPWNRANQRFLS